MKTIPLTRGKVAIVDDEDFEKVDAIKWYALKRRELWHASHKDKKRACIYMHRFIMAAPDGFEVDHVNGDGLDNRKVNLRVCTKRENARHRRSGDKTKTSRFQGVSRHPNGRWRAAICAGPPGPDGAAKQIHIGHFKDENDAARAYDRAALKYFGPFAVTNFPREDYVDGSCNANL